MRFFSRLFNFLVLGRSKVEIQTPQFLGSQDKFYMFKQIGWFYYIGKKFVPDKKQIKGHKVYFETIEQAHKSILQWL